MADINNKDLTKAFKNINTPDPSKFSLGKSSFSSYLDTTKFHDAALRTNQSSKEILTVTSCKDEPFEITPRDQIVSGSGFSIKEKNPPQPNHSSPNNVPVSGTPSPISPNARGVVCGTSVGTTNLDLSFNCNFVAGINLDSCLFKYQKEVKLYIKKGAKFLVSLGLSNIPFLNWFTNQFKNLCEMANQLSKIVCFIQQLITCIMSTIQSILSIIEWILSLPIRFIQMLIQCVTSFFGNIIGSMNSLASALTFAFSSLFGCNPFNCPSINNINDITDISNVTSDIGKINWSGA